MSVANVSVIAASARLSPMRGALRFYERKPGGYETTAPGLQRSEKVPLG
jgi:hypothetical protein